MKRILAIVLSALLLVTTFLSVPLIISADAPASVDIDFSEAPYVNATYSNNAYYYNDINTMCYSNVVDFNTISGASAADKAHGYAFKFPTIKGSAYGWANNSGYYWPPAVRIMQEDGSATFDMEVGKEYKVVFDIKTVSAGAGFKVVANTGGGLGNHQGATVLSIESGAATDWVTREALVSVTKAGCVDITIRNSADNVTGKVDAEVYIDNVKITEIVEGGESSVFEVDLNYSGYSDSNNHKFKNNYAGYGEMGDDATYGRYINPASHFWGPSNYPEYNSFRLANSNGQVFTVEEGKTYEMICDFYTDCTASNCAVFFDTVQSGKNVYDGGLNSTAYVDITPVIEGTWTADKVFTFTAPSTGDLRVSISSKGEAAKNQTCYFANITISEKEQQVVVVNGTDVDFDEDYYQDGTNTSNTYNTTLTTDPDTASGHGSVMNISTIGGNWPNGICSSGKFVVANAEGNGPFMVENGKKYDVSLDLKVTKAEQGAHLYVVSSVGSLSWMQYSEKKYITTISAGTGGSWKTISFSMTADSNYAFTLSLYGASTGNSVTQNQEIYVDNIRISESTDQTITINKNNGEAPEVVTVPGDSQFSQFETPIKSGYDFDGWYKDAELTQEATGVVAGTSAIYAKWVPCASTFVDFSEDYYQDGTNTSNVYNTTLATDPDTTSGHGDVMNLSSIGGNWPNGIKSCGKFVVANGEGNGAFMIKNGKTYSVSLDIKVTKAEKAAKLYLVASGGGLGWSQYTEKILVTTISAGTGGSWNKVSFTFTADADYAFTLALYGADTGNDITKNQEIYVDNIDIKAASNQYLILHKNNGESDEKIAVTNITNFSTIEVPYKAGYAFAGWFTDEALSNDAIGLIGSVTDIYAKWVFVPSVNVVDFNEPVYRTNSDFFIYNSSLAEDLDGSGNNAALLTKARHPSQGWHTAVRVADYAGTGAYQMVSGQAYNIKISYRVDYAERPHSLYIWVGQSSNNLRPENGKKIASFDAMTDYGDGLFRVYDAGIFVAPASGSVHLGFVADAYPDMDDQELYLDDITIEKLETPDVTLHLNNGQADKTVKVTLIDKHFAIEVPTYAGHTFEGWFTDAALTQPFSFAGLSSDTFSVTDLYAKWGTTPTAGYEFETGFEAGETGAYTNNGSNSDKTNNYQNMHSYIDANFDNANTGKGVLVLNGDDGQYVSDSTHYLSTALADKDGKYFQVVKGTRYHLTYSVLLTGNANGNLYTGISTSDNVPVGAINATNLHTINQHYSGGTDLTHFEVWYEREVYFIAKETGKVYFWAHVAAPEQVICYDDVKFEIADPDKTALISYYNEDGTPYINGLTSPAIHFETFGACGEWITDGAYPPNQSKTGYKFDGWRIGSPTGEQFVSNRYPDEDIKLYASWKVADTIPENPVTPLDKNDSVYLDFEDTNATRAFYEQSGNATGGYYGLYMVTGDPDKAHSGSNYYQYYHAGHWMKQYYRTMRFFNAASPDGKVWVEPNTTYKISYWYNPDAVGASNLYLANFNSEYADGYEILAENYLEDANIFDQFGKWNYYETTVFTGDFKGQLGFVLYGGYFTVAIDDITVTKCQTVELTFNSNGGTEIPVASGMSHHTFIAPEDPEREGYDFAGWFTDAALTKPFDFAKDTVDKAMTLYAKWTAKKYKTLITYEEKEVEVEVTPEDAHLDDAASFNDTKDKIGTIAGDILEQGTSLAWLWILLACVGGAVVLGGAAILIIVLIKRKKGA